MTANVFNFELNQGSDYTFPMKLQDTREAPINLTGFSARMQIRRTAGACEVIDSLSSSGDDPRITIEAKRGRMSLSFPHAITEKYPVAALVYDIEIESRTGEVTRLLQGTITVSAEVTRDSRCNCGGK